MFLYLQILAHEIGHNLGMDHDFIGSQGVIRRDAQGRSCTNIGGVMDYNQRPFDKWSTCSVQDFLGYYNFVLSRLGGRFCVATR